MVHRILIVEDDAGVREALAEAMADSGAEVSVAADGFDALALLRSGQRPSAILLDLRLPHLGGEAFLAELRGDPRFERVPVITMTAGPGEAEGSDVVARVHKPVDVEDLRKIVMSLFEFAA
jgi:CheY-like chemotaxis protein